MVDAILLSEIFKCSVLVHEVDLVSQNWFYLHLFQKM